MSFLLSSALTVFPEPVCAQAIKSLLAKTVGIAYFCTGVGFVYLAFLTLSKTPGARLASSKLLIALGNSPGPVTSTGMLSY